MNLTVLRVVLICVLLSYVPAQCSEGDYAQEYGICHAACVRSGCVTTGGVQSCNVVCPGLNSYIAPASLEITQWDCTADCSYHCMWAIEAPKAAAASGPVFKYHGKWPFIRVLGAQEMASVAFSIGNLLAHAHNLVRYARHAQSLHVTRQQYPYLCLWPAYSLASINAWLWSSVFHTRDTKVTEKFDYFSADILVAVGFFTATVRGLGLRGIPAQVVVGLLVASGLLQHIYFMAFVKFDYGYNMKVCISIGVLTALAWVVWVTYIKHPGQKLVYQFMVLVHLAMLLEVVDFSPLLWLFDAHALWHAATVPLTYLWYKFVFEDMQWCVAKASSAVVKKAPVLASSPSGKHKNGD